MTTNSSMDQLLDLLIDALEERKSQREPSEQAAQAAVEPVAEKATKSTLPSEKSPEKVVQPASHVKLPNAWLPFAAAQNIYSVGDVTPAFLESIKRSNPHLLKKAKSAHWQAMPDAALAALPATTVRNMAYSVRLDVQRRIAAFQTVEPIEVDDLDAYEQMEPVEDVVEPVEDARGEEVPPIVLEVADSAEIEPPLEQPAREITKDNLPRTLSRMFMGLILIVVLANLKIIDYQALNAAVGTAGNRGNERVVFARDGMLLRANNSNKVYLMENNKRRWVSTPEAFNQFGYRWGAVRVVSPEYVAQFEEGKNKDLLAACPGSPHIFTISLDPENARARRVRHHIQDVEAFSAEGFRWEDISYNYCNLLTGTVVGESIPPDPNHEPPNPRSSR